MPNGMSHEQMVEKIFDEIDDASDGRRRLHEKLDTIKDEMVTKSECQTIRKNNKDRINIALMRLKDLVILSAALAGFLWGSGILPKR